MNYVVIIELRGFTAISECLSRELEDINVSSADIRSSIISILTNIIDQIKEHDLTIRPQFENILGGDTWGFVFDNFINSLNFCCKVLSALYNNLHTKGLFYLKPSVSISCTRNVSIRDGKLLDDGYISSYRLADKGHSFTLYFHESLSDDLNAKQFFISEYLKVENDRNIFNWQKYSTELEIISDVKASIYDIMFDDNIMFLDNIEKSVNNFIELQNKSKDIFILGGSIDYTQQHFCDYLKSIINLFHNKKVFCTVINFIRPNMNTEKIYIAVSIFKKLMDKYPDKLAYSVYQIPDGLPIPIPFHIYDNQYIQFIMRKYMPQRSGLLAVSSFMIKSKKICEYYRDEILENYRNLKKLDSSHYDLLVKALNLDAKKVENLDRIVEQFLREELA